MKRFIDLTPAQKKDVILRQMKETLARVLAGGTAPTTVKNDAKKLRDSISLPGGFCGCLTCVEGIFANINKFDRLKEYLLVDAEKTVLDTYFVEPDDKIGYV